MPSPRVEDRDEELLVARARNGDQDAFAALVRIHQDEMYTLALRLTGSPDRARDVTQDALIRA
ncbi:MAG: RNA polymerase subunit sigma-70, partial [Acidimicrobiia bacterium]|nr:RNA polymerase subunit sigma-70 [Acidimicrobiia bacterium]